MGCGHPATKVDIMIKISMTFLGSKGKVLHPGCHYLRIFSLATLVYVNLKSANQTCIAKFFPVRENYNWNFGTLGKPSYPTTD